LGVANDENILMAKIVFATLVKTVADVGLTGQNARVDLEPTLASASHGEHLEVFESASLPYSVEEGSHAEVSEDVK
jgi:hypothetical protein